MDYGSPFNRLLKESDEADRDKGEHKQWEGEHIQYLFERRSAEPFPLGNCQAQAEQKKKPVGAADGDSQINQHGYGVSAHSEVDYRAGDVGEYGENGQNVGRCHTHSHIKAGDEFL